MNVAKCVRHVGKLKDEWELIHLLKGHQWCLHQKKSLSSSLTLFSTAVTNTRLFSATLSEFSAIWESVGVDASNCFIVVTSLRASIAFICSSTSFSSMTGSSSSSE